MYFPCVDLYLNKIFPLHLCVYLVMDGERKNMANNSVMGLKRFFKKVPKRSRYLCNVMSQ